MKKNWYESKAIWSGLVLIGLGIYTYVTGATLADSVITALEGLGIVGIRQAVQ